MSAQRTSRIVLAQRTPPMRLSASSNAWRSPSGDNGKGFELTRVADPHAVGLIGMRERAHLMGAKLDIHSTPGVGTTVRLEIPIIDRR